MKIHLTPHRSAFCLKRIEAALLENMPAWIEPADDGEEADLYVMYVTGTHDHRVREAQNIIKAGKQYAVIQLVLGSSRNPRPEEWLDLWEPARLVWSYYDLSGCLSDYYHAPLGPGSDVFSREEGVEKIYHAGSLGEGAYYKAECYGELFWALWQLPPARGVHIGTGMPANPIVDYFKNPTDNELRLIYNQCRWFSCLRRKDGFEMPAVEALLCGTRPIMFDTPNYRQWFDGHAFFIPEEEPAKVAKNLLNILKRDPDDVPDEEIQEIRRRFDWKRITSGFYDGISSNPGGGSSGP